MTKSRGTYSEIDMRDTESLLLFLQRVVARGETEEDELYRVVSKLSSNLNFLKKSSRKG